MKKFIFILLIVIAQMQNIFAQEVFNKMQPGGQVAYLNFEFDPVFALVAGYARSFEINAINRSLTLTGNVTLPIFLLDFKHYQVEVGSRIPFFNSESWNIINRLSLIYKKTDNPVYTGNLFSIEEGLLFGYFSNKWYIAGECDYEKFLWVKLKHTDWYRDMVYDDVKDWWYSSTGGNISFGLQGGYTFSNIIEFALRLGMYKTEGFNNPAGMPFFTNIGVNYHF